MDQNDNKKSEAYQAGRVLGAITAGTIIACLLSIVVAITIKVINIIM